VNGRGRMTLPGGFFSTIITQYPTVQAVGFDPYQYVSGDGFTLSDMGFYARRSSNAGGTSGSLDVTVFIVGF
jgi:hypothetical protein